MIIFLLLILKFNFSFWFWSNISAFVFEDLFLILILKFNFSEVHVLLLSGMFWVPWCTVHTAPTVHTSAQCALFWVLWCSMHSKGKCTKGKSAYDNSWRGGLLYYRMIMRIMTKTRFWKSTPEKIKMHSWEKPAAYNISQSRLERTVDRIPAKCNIQPYEWKTDLVNHTLIKPPPLFLT